MKHLFVLGFILSLVQCLQYAHSAMVIVKRLQCTGQPYEVSKLYACHLKTFRNGTQLANIVLEILSILHKVYVTYDLSIQYMRTRTHLLSTTLEYCQHQQDSLPLRNAVSMFIFDFARQHVPQVLTDCPVRPYKMFNLTNVHIKQSMIPPYVPMGSYYAELRVYNKRNQTIFQGSAEADFK